MRQLISRLMREEEGQGMAEYGMILALIAVVVVAALTALGTNIQGIFESVTDTLTP